MDFSVLEPHLFRNAQLYAPEDLGHCDLLIAGGKIVAVEKAGHATTRPDCPESDLAGAVVCPGFIDQHVHLIGGGGEAGPHTRTPEVRLSALVAAGITSVVGLLGTDGVTRHPESLLAKTRALEHEGISAWMLTGAYGLPSPTITGSIEKDVALIDKIIGVKCAISDHRSSAPADDQLANNADVPRTKLLPTHVNRAQALFHAALDYAREGGYIDITTSISEPVDAATAIATAREAQVPFNRLTLSSDGNGSQPNFDANGNLVGIGVAGFESLLETLQQLVGRYHLPLEEALLPFTRNVAEFLGLEHKGRIAPGCDADVLVLTDDLKIREVWAKGRQMVSGGVVCVKGTFE